MEYNIFFRDCAHKFSTITSFLMYVTSTSYSGVVMLRLSEEEQTSWEKVWKTLYVYVCWWNDKIHGQKATVTDVSKTQYSSICWTQTIDAFFIVVISGPSEHSASEPLETSRKHWYIHIQIKIYTCDKNEWYIWYIVCVRVCVVVVAIIIINIFYDCNELWIINIAVGEKCKAISIYPMKTLYHTQCHW